MKCIYCNGEGYDPYDTDPLGGLMYSRCPRCNGTGLSDDGIKDKARREIERGIDSAWEKFKP